MTKSTFFSFLPIIFITLFLISILFYLLLVAFPNPEEYSFTVLFERALSSHKVAKKTPVPTPTPNSKGQSPSNATTKYINTLYISFVTAVLFAIATISTLIFSWRNDRRNKIETGLRIEKLELEIIELKTRNGTPQD